MNKKIGDKRRML